MSNRVDMFWICFGYVLWICFIAISSVVVDWCRLEKLHLPRAPPRTSQETAHPTQSPTAPLQHTPWSFVAVTPVSLPSHPTIKTSTLSCQPCFVSVFSFTCTHAPVPFSPAFPLSPRTRNKKKRTQIAWRWSIESSLFLLIIGRYDVSFMSYVMNGMYWWRWRRE